MLKPAIAYKEELLKKFAETVYSEDYFYYSGYGHCHYLPEVKAEDNRYQWVMVNSNNEVIGWLAYSVDLALNSVYNFGLYSFDHGNPIVGKDLFEHLELLVKRHRRIEWRVISGNPVIKHYDRFCEKHNGNRVTLHEVCKDVDNNYHDEFIYEIIS